MQMSFAGGVLILVIIVIRALSVNLLPKQTFPVLWGIALLRLLIPFSIPSALSVYSLTDRHMSAAQGIHGRPTVGIVPIEGRGQTDAAFGSFPNIAAPVSIWTIIWAVGVLICGLVFVMAYRKCLQEFRTSLPADNDFLKGWLHTHRLKRTICVRQSGRVSAPLTYGVFRPVILVPTSAKWEDKKGMEYVMAHEFVHIRRFDSITKLLLITVLCIHWFNPLAWAMYFLANRDLELSCDAAVVRLFGEQTRADYARTLIGMEEIRSGFMPLCNNFKSNAMEERITAIMKYKKTCIFSLVPALSLIFGVTTVFATSARPETKFSITDEAGKTVALEGQPMIAPRFFVDDEGNCVYYPDSKLIALADQFGYSVPSAGFDTSDFGYKVTLEGFADGRRFESHTTDDSLLIDRNYRHRYTDAEMEQIIADIESGKIPGYRMSDFVEGKVPGFELEDGAEVSVEFTYYPDGDGGQL